MTGEEVARIWIAGYTSIATRRAYSHDLDLVAWEMGHRRWELLDRAVVANVLTGLRLKRSPNTIRRIHAALKAFAGELAAYGLITGMAYQGIRRQKLQLPKADPVGRYLSRAERALLFAAIRHAARSPKEELMMGAALAMGLGAGMRYSEVTNIGPGDYDTKAGCIRIRSGKGDKERFVYVAGEAKVYVDKLAGSGVRMKEFTHEVWDSLRYHAGLRTVVFHDLRRTFASDAWDAGIDASTVAAMLGHANINTSMKYDRRGDYRKKRAAEAIMAAQKGK